MNAYWRTRDRTFFKLPKMTLVSVSNGMTVTPNVVTLPPAPGTIQNAIKPVELNVADPSPAVPPPQQIAVKRAVPNEADQEAIEALMMVSCDESPLN